MHRRQRNPNGGFGSGYRYNNRGGGRGRGGPPPRLRKEDILMEAGRLAAEYLVFKGLLPPSSIHPNWIGHERSSVSIPDTHYSPRRIYDGFSDQFRGRNQGYFEEFVEESGSQNIHDVASSSSNRKEVVAESDADLRKVGDGGRVVESDASDDSKKDVVVEEVLSDVTEDDGGLGKLEQEKEESPKVEQDGGEYDAVKVTVGEDTKEDLSSEDRMVTPTPDDGLSDLQMQAVQEVVSSGEEAIQSVAVVTEEEETVKKEGLKRSREPSPDDENTRLDNLRSKTLTPEEKCSADEEMDAVVAADQEINEENMVATVEVDKENEEMIAPVADELVDDEIDTKVVMCQGKPAESSCPQLEVDVKLEEEKSFSSLFKTRDLNLMSTPEITEIPDDPVIPDQLLLPASSVDTTNGLSVNVVSLSSSAPSNGTEDSKQIPGDDDKVVQVINLDDDSTVEANALDPSKPRDEPAVYPNMDNFLSQAEHADLPGIQDGYSLALSEFLGTDMSDMQDGIGLHNAEGVPIDDDSIYVSYGDMPIGFMEVWNQSPQHYDKFF